MDAYHQLLIMQAEAKARYDAITEILQGYEKPETSPKNLFGDIVRNARTELNLTKAELAEKIGYGKSGANRVSK